MYFRFFVFNLRGDIKTSVVWPHPTQILKQTVSELTSARWESLKRKKCFPVVPGLSECQNLLFFLVWRLLMHINIVRVNTGQTKHLTHPTNRMKL